MHDRCYRAHTDSPYTNNHLGMSSITDSPTLYSSLDIVMLTVQVKDVKSEKHINTAMLCATATIWYRSTQSIVV